MSMDLAQKRKKRLQGLLGTVHFDEGGEVEEPEMDMGPEDFLSDEDDDLKEDDVKQKRKDRLFALLAPKFKRK